MNPERYSKGWTEKKVLYHLYNHFRANSKYFCRNKFVYDWESDGFFMTKSGMAYELEVKVTRSDFAKETKDKKKKHDFLSSVWESGGEVLKNPRYNPTKPNSNEFKAFCPNKFNIVCQAELIYPEEVEEIFPYAGLMWVTDDGKVINKSKKQLHKLKQDIKPVLLDKFFWRVHHLDYELYNLKSEFEKLPKSTLSDGAKMTKFIKDFIKKVKV